MKDELKKDIEDFLKAQKEKSYCQQEKKDKDDAQNVALSGDTNYKKGKTIKNEHMPSNGDNHPADTSSTNSALKLSNEDNEKIFDVLKQKIEEATPEELQESLDYLEECKKQSKDKEEKPIQFIKNDMFSLMDVAKKVKESEDASRKEDKECLICKHLKKEHPVRNMANGIICNKFVSQSKGCGIKIATMNGKDVKCGEWMLGKIRYCNKCLIQNKDWNGYNVKDYRNQSNSVPQKAVQNEIYSQETKSEDLVEFANRKDNQAHEKSDSSLDNSQETKTKDEANLKRLETERVIPQSQLSQGNKTPDTIHSQIKKKLKKDYVFLDKEKSQ